MPNGFTLVTDSSCDMPREYLEENGIVTLQLSFTLNDKTCRCDEMEPEEFYAQVRAGAMPITAQVNVKEATSFIEPLLEEGHDILYIAFSSGLSGTYASGQIAANDLSEKYPDRRIIVIDSLCASMGQGLMLYKVNELKKQGQSIDEIAAWAQAHTQHISHYVAASDLMHLHRGGRVSKASALVGSVLGIRPIIWVNEEGKLIMVDKVRGRKQSLARTVELLAQAVGNAENDICFISHSDCIEDAEYVAELVKKRLGIENFLINYIGPVIGSHTGQGTIAVFLMSEHK